MASRAQVREARAGFFPTVTTDPSVATSAPGTTARGAGGGPPAPNAGSTGAATTGKVSLPLDVSWAPDVWERVRSTVREYR